MANPTREPQQLLEPKKSGIQKAIQYYMDQVGPAEVTETGPWQEWVPTAFGWDVFADHHRDLWAWAWDLRLGNPNEPFVAIWPRGHGKSAMAHAIVVSLGARREARYVLYVSATQEQANKHIGEIEQLLTSPFLESEYQALTERDVNKYGNPRGWRRDRLATSSGLTVDGLGLDTAARGVKFDDRRPDLIIVDDVDHHEDSPDQTAKKEDNLRRKILQAGTAETDVLMCQNLIKEDGVFDRIQSGAADYMLNARISGPLPAVRGLEYERIETDDGYEYHITDGEATWQGLDLEDCERIINRDGPSVFLRECQHEVEDTGGGIFDGVPFQRCTWADLPELVRVTVWVDPAVTSNDDSDCMAIQADALGADERVYRLFSWERVATPERAMRKALSKAVELGADTVGVETDQGGETWKSVFKRAWSHMQASGDYPQITVQTPRPAYKEDKAASHAKSKTARGMQMLEDYERGQVVHVQGTHRILEKALNRAFVKKPFDLADAAFYAWFDLRSTGRISVDTIS